MARNKRLTSAESSEDILELVAKEAEQYNYVNASTALHRLSKHASCERRRAEVRRDARLGALLEVVKRTCVEFKPQNIANTLWAYATLGLQPGEGVVEALEAQARREAGRFSSQAIANTLWAYAVLDKPHLACMLQAASTLHSTGSWQRMYLHQLFQAQLAAEAAGSKLGLPDELVTLARKAWMQDVVQTTKSRFQKQVVHALERLGLAPVEEHVSADGLFSIDAALLGEGGAAGVAVEADGPWHFLRNTRAPVGSTILRRRLLEARGWAVVSVPYYEWGAVAGDPGAEEAYLRKRLGGLVGALRDGRSGPSQ